MTRTDSTKPDPADELYLDSIGREGDETVVRMHGAEQTLGHMALAMRDVWSAQPEGTNYVELGVSHEGKAWRFAVYPAGNPTPHDKRREAEAKFDALTKVIAELANDLESDSSQSRIDGEEGRADCLFFLSQELRTLLTVATS